MPTVNIADRLYLWTITLESGEVKNVLGASLDTVISGSMRVVSATRGAAVVSDPVPTVSGLTPSTAAVGAADFTLHVTGTGYRAGCQIFWDGAPMPTTVVSPTELTTPISLAGLVAPKTIPVKVRSLTGLDSNVMTFSYTLTE